MNIIKAEMHRVKMEKERDHDCGICPSPKTEEIIEAYEMAINALRTQKQNHFVTHGSTDSSSVDEAKGFRVIC